MGLKSLYLQYLMDLTGLPDGYYDLCTYLNAIPFLYDPHFITDRNRLEDGLELRSLYFHDTGKSSGMEPNEASVLEVMVALAIRIDRDIMGEPGTSDPGKWLVTMFENLGLDASMHESEVRGKITAWLYRQYGRDGQGSLFPLRKKSIDQRGITIWDQMNEYMVENY